MLNSNRIEYLLVGGYAVGYHGYPRATVDIDIWVNNKKENAEKVVRVLKEFGFDVPELSVDVLLKEDQVIRMGVPPVRIEILTGVSGVDFEECYSQRIEDVLDEVEVTIISLKHLKINKKASGRHSDLADLENLV